jgi:hypothetical protein
VFGTKGLSKRIARAVDPTLRPGETKIVSVYLHDPKGAQGIGVTLPDSPLSIVIKTWIVTLTDQRVIIHKGDEMNAARSQFVGDVTRDRVAILSAEPADKPKDLVLSFDDDAGHEFWVPALWRHEAAQFVDELQSGS